jgi:hypothetical protein
MRGDGTSCEAQEGRQPRPENPNRSRQLLN